ncbi:RagB/SusD family nutrient uptake outer membrane protein [Galbibacter sp. PAP.153]|uniref:RagB/SusD family nutrient uptake outer membrane protein n=1 Tax=Galbibacter sp. PAP.153 TaxID=3104623 RepID=UPI003008D559
MKNLKYFILITFISTSFFSCDDDFLDTVPNDRISSELFWQTDQDAVFAANAVYPFLLQDAFSFTMWDAMSDIGHVTLQWRDESLVEKGAHNSSNGKVASEWAFAYRGIQAANIFMGNVEKMTPQDPALIERLKAEVKVIRAYSYIRLAILYGDVPLVDHELTLEESRELTRTPVEQVWDFISDELTAAAASLPKVQSDKGRITKGAALALKARAMLYAGRYTEAALAAKEVMDLQVYSLNASYKDLFSYQAQNTAEIILDRQFAKNVNNNNIFNLTTPNSIWPQVNQFVPRKRAVDAYQMANGKDITDPTSGFDPYNPYINRDPRLGYTIYTLGDTLLNGTIYNPEPNSGTGDAIGSSENSTFSGFNVKKYLNPEDMAQPTNCGINIILLRYAEVLLTYAEAKIEANDIDQSVLDAINEVRQRPDVNMPPITVMGGQEELREIVRKERTVELAFEGLRYFDIRRWRIAEDLTGIIKGMTYENNSGELVTIALTGFDIAFDKERDYLWPIPNDERVLNPNLTQNPGW